VIRFATLFSVLLVLGTDACAAELGRLFYTPAQRTQLDTLRSQKNIAPPAPEVKDAPAVPDTVTYGGVVRRSDGRSTVWINNRAVNDGKPLDELSISSRVRPDHSVTLQLPQAPGVVKLKVGQSIDVTTGTIAEPYSRRRDAPAAAPKRDPSPPPPARAAGSPRAVDEEDEERPRR
jgi:hypothetical protein